MGIVISRSIPNDRDIEIIGIYATRRATLATFQFLITPAEKEPFDDPAIMELFEKSLREGSEEILLLLPPSDLTIRAIDPPLARCELNSPTNEASQPWKEEEPPISGIPSRPGKLAASADRTNRFFSVLHHFYARYISARPNGPNDALFRMIFENEGGGGGGIVVLVPKETRPSAIPRERDTALFARLRDSSSRINLSIAALFEAILLEQLLELPIGNCHCPRLPRIKRCLIFETNRHTNGIFL